MSTPAVAPVTTEQAQTMPLQDLAAAINNPPAPAAPDTPAAPVETPATPAAPATPAPENPYTLTTNQDGTIEVKYATGEVFKGTPEQVLAETAKAHVSTKRWAQQKVAQATPPAPEVPATPAPVTPPAAPQPSDEDMEVARYIGNVLKSNPDVVIAALAAQMNIPPDQAAQAIQGMFKTSNEMALNNTLLTFVAECTDYVDSPENQAVLAEYVNQMVPAGHIPTAAQLKQAHALAKYENKYKAAPSTPAATIPRPTPPPIPTAGSTAVDSGFDPYTAPMNDPRWKTLGK